MKDELEKFEEFEEELEEVTEEDIARVIAEVEEMTFPMSFHLWKNDMQTLMLDILKDFKKS